MNRDEKTMEASESNLNESGVVMSRPVMNQDEFDACFGCEAPKYVSDKRYLVKKFFRPYYRPFLSFQSFLRSFLSFFPIIHWLPKYSIKEDLLTDVVGGFTVGVMHVPQGIAYATLAEVPPVLGLYISFFPALCYMLFGSSRHNSIGSFALVSLMAGLATIRIIDQYNHDHNIVYNDTIIICEDDCSPAVTNIQVASMLTITIGFMHIIMGLMRMKFISAYFSDQLVAGFTTAAAFHVLGSQLVEVFGIRGIKKRSGFGQLIRNCASAIMGFIARFIDLGSNITASNLYSIGISIVGTIFLHVGKEYVNPYVKKKLKKPIPIPFELILVIISTTLSAVFNLKEKLGLRVVDEIPTGMPHPSLPLFRLFPYVIPDCLGLAVVVIAVHISLAKMFAKKYVYKVDIGQEFYALGFTSLICGFFPMFVPASALGRTAVNAEIGSKTQLSSFFSSALILAVILYFGKFLEALPRCVLSVIVIVALKGMFKQLGELKSLWRLSTIDVSIWLVSFVATVVYDIKEGLMISIAFALLTTVFRTQWSTFHVLGNLTGTDDYRDIERYKEVTLHKGILVVRFDSPLIFTSVDRFRQAVTKALEEWNYNNEAILVGSPYASRNAQNSSPVRITISNSPKRVSPKPYETSVSKHFIIDCSGITFVDCMGVTALKDVYDEMCARKVQVYFASAKANVRELFESRGFYKFVPKENFYPTIHDAVMIARRRQRSSLGSISDTGENSSEDSAPPSV